MEMSVLQFISLIVLLQVSIGSNAKVIALVGDSLTWGFGSSNPSTKSYPAVLQTFPGFIEHRVLNFGDNGKCAMKRCQKASYWNSLLNRAINSLPNIVVIMLGTNDAKDKHWNEKEFRRDYTDLVYQFKNISTNPSIFICIPPPLISDSIIGYADIRSDVINDFIPRIIPEIAQSIKEVQVIDNFNRFGGANVNDTNAYLIIKNKPMHHGRNDGCHLSDAGYEKIAGNVAQAIIKHL